MAARAPRRLALQAKAIAHTPSRDHRGFRAPGAEFGPHFHNGFHHDGFFHGGFHHEGFGHESFGHGGFGGGHFGH
jgi:hypothetical protein